MKHIFFASVLLTSLACRNGITYFNGDDTTPVTTITFADTTLQGNWKLVPVMASDTATGKIPFINFDLKTNRFTGNTGCNSLSGGFMVKNDALSFAENMVSTEMACPGYNEQPFLDNLLKTNRYQIKNGVLQLMYNTTVLSQWSRRVDTSSTKQI